MPEISIVFLWKRDFALLEIHLKTTATLTQNMKTASTAMDLAGF